MKSTYKVHFSTYLFYLFLILSGYFNYLLIYLIIIFFHELGHFLMIKLNKLHIEEFVLYPFGGIIKTDINYNISSNLYFGISISGILMQLFLFLFIKDNGSYNYTIFYNLNWSIIIFNLLPIIPSDGSKILSSLLERFLPYKCVLYISHFLSIITLFILFLYSKNIFLFIVLYYLNINSFFIIKYIYNKFLLERYLYQYVYFKEKYVENENSFYKCRKNMIKYGSNYIEEKRYLSHKFEQFY